MEELNYQAVSELLFPDEKELNKTADERFSDEIRSQIKTMRKQSWSRLYPELLNQINNEAKYKELADFLRTNVKNTGEEQSIKDFQTGINLLTKNYKADIKADGIYGLITHSTFSVALKYYSLKTVKKYLRRGIINNLIFETKNNLQIDTNEEVNKIGRDLIIESRN